jgi:hypothetical protein
MAYVGATGLKTTDLIEEAEEKSLLASLVNSATDVITDDIKGRVEDAILSYFDTAAAQNGDHQLLMLYRQQEQSFNLVF